MEKQREEEPKPHQVGEPDLVMADLNILRNHFGLVHLAHRLEQLLSRYMENEDD